MGDDGCSLVWNQCRDFWISSLLPPYLWNLGKGVGERGMGNIYMYIPVPICWVPNLEFCASGWSATSIMLETSHGISVYRCSFLARFITWDLSILIVSQCIVVRFRRGVHQILRRRDSSAIRWFRERRRDAVLPLRREPFRRAILVVVVDHFRWDFRQRQTSRWDGWTGRGSSAYVGRTVGFQIWQAAV